MSCPAITNNEDVYCYSLHGNAYLNITNRCTLRCRFCPKFNGEWTVQDYALRIHEEPSVQTLLHALGEPGRYEEVVFCGLGEPTLRLEVMRQTGIALRRKGVSVRVNTDGLANWVYRQDVSPILGQCVDSVSVSLNTQNSLLYDYHCRPPQAGLYQEVLSFIRAVREYVPHVIVTAIDGLSGVDIKACKDIAIQEGVEFRRRVLDQVG